MTLFPLQTFSQSELRQDCVLFHCWRTLSPDWIYPCSRPSAGAGVVVISCKSVLMFFTSTLHFKHPIQHWCLCRYTILNEENTNFPSFFPEYMYDCFNYTLFPRVKTDCSSCVKVVMWLKLTVQIQRSCCHPKRSIYPNYPEDLSGSGASNPKLRSEHASSYIPGVLYSI